MSPHRVTRKEQAQRRREQLLQAALELFVERGVENVSIADLAAHSGVAHGLVYHYFASKDALLLAVLEHANPREGFEKAAESVRGMPAEEGIRAFAEQVGAIAQARGEVLRFLVRESLSPRSVLPAGIADVQEQVLGSLAGYLQERIDAGELRPHDPRAPLRMLISSLLVLVLVRQPTQPWVDSFVETILLGIGTTTGAGDGRDGTRR